MGFELKPGQGSMFKNDKKGNAKAPDYKGTVNFNGVTLEVAGWIKMRTGKEPFMSLSVKEKQARGVTQKDVEDVFNDGAPF